MDRANQLYITGLELTCEASRRFPVPINHHIGNIVGPTMQIGDLMKYENITYTSQAGLQLYARDYGSRQSPLTPVLCLPGLTRNSKDFHAIASHLAPHRRVLCPDFRGRGKSEYAAGWTDYSAEAEMRDTLDLLAAAGVHKVIAIGTSRGGLVTLQMALQRPTLFKGVVLNDVGPEIDPTGIKRIAGYAGKMSAPDSWNMAAILLRQMNDRYFPALTGDEWHAFARLSFRDENGKPALDYDPQIGTGLRRALSLTRGKLPTMWREFKALNHVPLLILRGEYSDLLSTDVAKRMVSDHPNAKLVTIPGQGHAPLLDEKNSISAIDAFLEQIDS